MYIFRIEFSVILMLLWMAMVITFARFRYKKINRFKDRDRTFRISSLSGNIIYAIGVATLVIIIPFMLLL